MIYLILTILIFATIFYIGIKDAGVRVTKYFTLILVGLASLYLWYIGFEGNFSACFIFLFLLDEWLSLIPKIEKWNRINRVSVANIEMISFADIKNIELDKEFEMYPYVNGKILEKSNNIVQFLCWSKSATTTKKYIKDFQSELKVLSGTLKISIFDMFDNETEILLDKGDTFKINAYVPHSFQAFDNKVEVNLLAKKNGK